MLIIRDCSVEEFQKDVANKKLIVWGAGYATQGHLETMCQNLNVVAILDNNAKLWGKTYIVREKSYPIMGLQQLYDFMKQSDVKEYAIFLSLVHHVPDVLEQLHQEPRLDGMICYMAMLLRNHYQKHEFSFPSGIQRIPKKIHYCWFGGKEIPEHLQKYMETWSKYCPDYEIIRWDETNYDYTKHPYMKQAYQCKKWGFVSDYARLDIIYQQGGIYLDTDVELISSLDPLLRSDVFLGFGFNYVVNTGVGFGAIAKHPLIQALRDDYDQKVFLNKDGTMNLKPCMDYQHVILEQFGFVRNNRFQNINNCILYPSEVLSPRGYFGIKTHYTEKSIAVHHDENSWVDEKVRKERQFFIENISQIINTT